jgi:hypothetical protein
MKDIIKDTLISYSGRINSYKTNAPSQYKNRKHQYFADVTRMFEEEYDRFSSDYVEASVQGLIPEDPKTYTDIHLRFANVVTGTSAVGTVYDDYKMVEISEKQYNYIRRGAKVITMGNVWLAINPDNMSGMSGKTVIQRCDNTWNHLDFYGNVMYEPVCVDRLDMRGVDPDSQRSTMINTGYYNIKVQMNDQTRQLDNNSRLYIGNVCYRIAGYAGVSREFTYEKDTVGLMVFRAMLEEPNLAIDDLDEYIAGGKTFSWNISVAGDSMVMVGESKKLSASSVRTAEGRTMAVESSEDHPVSYIWESSDDEILSVTSEGVITGVSEGNATVICKLEQNPSQSIEFNVAVQGDVTAPHLAFTTTIPESMKAFHSANITAAYYEDGSVVSDADIEWTFSGADKDSYTIEHIGTDEVSIKCWSGSVMPLTVTAAYNGFSTSAEIILEGI